MKTKEIEGNYVKSRRSKGRSTDEEKLRKEILKLLNKGMSINAIAKTLGVSRNTVRYHIKMAEVENLKEEYKQRIRALQRQEEELRKNYEQKFRELQELKQKLKERERVIIQEADKVYQEELRKRQEDIKQLEEEVKRLKSEKDQLRKEVAQLQKRKKELERKTFLERHKKPREGIKLRTDFYDKVTYCVIKFWVSKYPELLRWELEKELEKKLKALNPSAINVRWLIPILIIEGYYPLLLVEIEKNDYTLSEIVELIEKVTKTVEEELKRYMIYVDFIKNEIEVDKALIYSQVHNAPIIRL